MASINGLAGQPSIYRDIGLPEQGNVVADQLVKRAIDNPN
jgi:hypothetical protein